MRRILAVVAVALWPAIALGQERTDTAAAEQGQQQAQQQEAQPSGQSDTAQQQTGQQQQTGHQQQDVTTEAAGGEVETGGAAVSQDVLQRQKDPNLIGSPAWWSRHSTADGKPRQGGGQEPQG